jgi:hypothetical protein
MNEEEHLVALIQQIQELHNNQLNPYYERLAQIRAAKPRSFIVDNETFNKNFQGQFNNLPPMLELNDGRG